MILIVGFTRRTSYVLAKYLSKKHQTLIIVDQTNTQEQQELLEELKQNTTIIDELGNQDVSLLDKYDITQIFLSPGVPRAIPLIREAVNRNIDILNDIEYFYQLFPNRKYIAITGTDGKTTVTTWLGHVLQAQYKVVLVGNIGVPIFEYADEKYDDYIFLVELSSFQLESIQKFRPFISVITNINEDHLDRYDGIDEYARVKSAIFLNQKDGDIALINNNDPYIQKHLPEQVNKYYFSTEDEVEFYWRKGVFYRNGEFLMESKELQVLGEHNIQNALIIIAIATILKQDKEVLIKQLCSFKGVKYRLEFLGTFKGTHFYNDSKATTLQALTKAVTAFGTGNLVLLAGGQSKGLDYKTVKDIVRSRSKKILCFGEVADEMAQAWGMDICEVYPKLSLAFEQLEKIVQKDDVVVLSPGATSFDEFKSYEHRGQVFEELVKNFEKQ